MGFLSNSKYMPLAYAANSFLQAYNDGQDRDLKRQMWKAEQDRQKKLDAMTMQQAKLQEQDYYKKQNQAYNDSLVAMNPGLLSGYDPTAYGPNPVGQLQGMPSPDVIFKVREAMAPKQPKYSAGMQEFVDVYGRPPANAQEYVSFHKDKKGPGVTVNTGDVKLTEGEKAFDKEAAKELAGFFALGGSADVDKNLNQLDLVAGELESGKNLTGPLIGATPDAVLRVTNPEAVDVKEQVEEVIQRNLRLILGAQFTEKEGERLIARAYNPSLDEKTNLRRVRALIQSIKGAVAAKSAAYDYFSQHGTLKGFAGKRYNSIEDIERDMNAMTKTEAPDPLGIR